MMPLGRSVTRVALGVISPLLVAGCGFMSIGERPVPSVRGAVAVTAWQSEEPNLPDLGDTSTLDPDGLVARIAGSIEQQLSAPGLSVGHGILSRSGDRAVGYLQLIGPPATNGTTLAFEARLTLVRGSGGWTVTALESRAVCAVQLVGGTCEDTRGGGAPLPDATAPANPAAP
jgi:hypothetical protein